MAHLYEWYAREAASGNVANVSATRRSEPIEHAPIK
jgi:hypothetical protein